MSTRTPPSDALTPETPALHDLLGDTAPRSWWRRHARGLFWAGLCVGAGLAWTGWKWSQPAPAPRYLTETVKRGDLTLTVTANGTLQPTRLVNVGSELSGTVREVLVDANDQVRKGQLLVVLDTAKLQDQVKSARAALSAAQAQVQQAEASLQDAQAQWDRLETLQRTSGGRLPAAADMDSGQAALLRARATLASAQAGVLQAQAALSTNETNLAKASIRAPIQGTVLTRSVDPGNAVAASLQAVTLLSIAEDLGQLKLQVYVDEADVGAVREGQSASFTVSSFPTRRFPARITRIDYGATKTDNVVTYVATLQVDNHEGVLRPGMTAVASIVASQRQQVLLVPNTALRFTPADTSTAPQGSVLSRMMPRPPGTARKTAREELRPGARRIWLLRDGQAVSQEVETGISDGRMTEVQATGLNEGVQVITGQLGSGSKP